jgi:hypothetical protein
LADYVTTTAAIASDSASAASSAEAMQQQLREQQQREQQQRQWQRQHMMQANQDMFDRFIHDDLERQRQQQQQQAAALAAQQAAARTLNAAAATMQQQQIQPTVVTVTHQMPYVPPFPTYTTSGLPARQAPPGFVPITSTPQAPTRTAGALDELFSDHRNTRTQPNDMFQLFTPGHAAAGNVTSGNWGFGHRAPHAAAGLGVARGQPAVPVVPQPGVPQAQVPQAVPPAVAGGLPAHVGVPGHQGQQPPPVAQHFNPAQIYSPFVGDLGPYGVATLNTEQAINANQDLILWRGQTFQTDLERILVTQQLLSVGLAFPHARPETRLRLSHAMTMTGPRELTAAMAAFANQIAPRPHAPMAEQSVFNNTDLILLENPTLGNNNFSTAASKALSVGLGGQRLSGESSDSVFVEPLLQCLRDVITSFGLNDQAAYLLAGSLFTSSLKSYLNACQSSGTSFVHFWAGIQRLLIARRSPGMITNLLQKITSRRPTDLMRTLSTIHSLQKMLGSIQGHSEIQVMKNVRNSYFSLFANFFPAYAHQIRELDFKQMNILKNEAERLVQLGQDPTGAYAHYHPLISLQSVALMVTGRDALAPALHQPEPGPHAHQPLRRGGGAGGQGGGGQGGMGGFGNYAGGIRGNYGNPQFRNRRETLAIAENDLDTESTLAVTADEHEEAVGEHDIDLAQDDDDMLRSYYASLVAEVAKVEAAAQERKVRLFPPAKTTKQEHGSTGTIDKTQSRCFKCGNLGHWKNECSSNRNNSKNNEARHGHGGLHRQAQVHEVAELAQGEVDVECNISDLKMSDLLMGKE